MERLWAPWRMAYIKKKNKEKRCIFCRGRQKTAYPKKTYILAHSKLSYVILNKYPYISGHLMVVPKRHVSQLENLSEKEGTDIFLLVQKTIRILKKALKPQGVNVGLNLGKSAGAGITRHLHYHIVPRWQGDTNFMPVVGQSRVISDSLANTYRRLAPYYKR